MADAIGATALDLVDHLLNVGLFSLPTDSLLGSQDGASMSSAGSAFPGLFIQLVPLGCLRMPGVD